MASDMEREFDAIVGDYSPGEPVPQQAEEHDELIKDLDENLRRDLAAKSSYSADWAFYRRLMKGAAIDARHKETGELVQLSDDDSKKLRSQMNILRPSARSLVGKLTRVIPGVDVRPGSADFDETHGARVAKALIDYGMEDQEAEVKFIEAHEYIPETGNGFLQLVWDAYGGRKRAYCPQCGYSEADESLIGQPCPNCQMMQQQAIAEFQQQIMMAEQQAMGQVAAQLPPGTVPDPTMVPDDVPMPEAPPEAYMEIPNLVEVHEGKPAIIVRDPREVIPEAGARNLIESRRATIRVPLPVSTARQMYPEFADLIVADPMVDLDEQGESIRLGLDDEVGAVDDHCWVTEIHVKPTERHPHGRVIHRVNDLIVKDLGIDIQSDVPPEEQLDNPYYVLNRFPLYHFGFDRATGEFWFEPGIEHAWHRQAELNRMETSFREWAELWVKPRALVPIGSRISTDEISAEGEQLIKYNPNAGPVTPWPIQPWPSQLVARRDELAADIRLQMAITDNDAGVSPADPNGRAAAILEAESDQSIGPILKRNHAEWKALWRGYIQLFQALSPEDFTFAVAGPEGTVAYAFQEMVLRAGWDVILEEDDGLSRNKAVRLTQAIDLAAIGVYNDPLTGTIDAKQFMHHVGLNLPQAGYDMERTETAAASRAIQAILEGQMWAPMIEDDAQLFAREMLGWLRGPGRSGKFDPQQVMMVRQAYFYYAQLVIQDMMGGAMPGIPPTGMMGGAGGPGPGGPDQTAPGGSANGPGHMGTDLRAAAAQKVQQADRGAETVARTSPKHEG